jgi:predicted nucleic acid-binding protein
LDASALVKRYVAEPGREQVVDAMASAGVWAMARLGYVETLRALLLGAPPRGAAAFRAEWPAFRSIELTAELADLAVDLAASHQLSSADAVHLASALLVHTVDHVELATFDDRLAEAAEAEGLQVVPGKR